MRQRVLTCMLAVATCCGLMAIGPSSSAATTPTARPAANPTSESLAGYGVYGNIARHMTATWIVPKARCTSNAYSFIELGNFAADTFVELSAAGVNITCQLVKGTYRPQYQPYTYHGSQVPPEKDYTDPVAPDDKIVVSISSTRKGLTSVITNKTRHWTETWTIPSTQDQLVGGQFGLAPSPDPSVPLTNVGRVLVQATTANGSSITRLPVASRFVRDLATADGPLRAVTSNLTPPGGFSVTWRHP